MHAITKVLSVLVALEFLYIFYLETLATTSEKTSSVFGMTTEELSQKSVKVLFKNQGVYNGLLSVLILLAVFAFASKAAVAPASSERYCTQVLSSPWVLLPVGNNGKKYQRQKQSRI